MDSAVKTRLLKLGHTTLHYRVIVMITREHAIKMNKVYYMFHLM